MSIVLLLYYEILVTFVLKLLITRVFDTCFLLLFLQDILLTLVSNKNLTNIHHNFFSQGFFFKEAT